MSTWLVVWFVAGLTTTALLVAFGIALARHGLVLGRTARQMADEVGPIAADIQQESARVADGAARLRPSKHRGPHR